MHDDAPAVDDDPIGHFVHSQAPAVSVYVPAKHNVHNDPTLYDPFGQLVCVCVHDDAPADDDVPEGQVVHSTAPYSAAYVPAEQGVHTMVSKP